MTQAIAVLNAGSSSLKFSLFAERDGMLDPVLSGQIEGLLTAPRFVARDRDRRVVVECYGSLGQTGKGHGTGKAIILGLAGFEPESVDIEAIPAFLAQVEQTQTLCLGGEQPSEFPRIGAILFNRRKTLPAHSNGMTLRAYEGDTLVFEQTYYSIGGGFIVDEESFGKADSGDMTVNYPFKSAAELLAHCGQTGLSISALMLENEKCFNTPEEIYKKLGKIWTTMREGIERGCRTEGVLAGPLRVEISSRRLTMPARFWPSRS